MEIVWMVVSWIPTIAVTVCCFIVAVKCIWTLFLPYAMLLTPENRSWSAFPLIEIIPLGFAVIIAWATNLNGWYSPRIIGTIGSIVIGFSYAHFLVIGIVGGYFRAKSMEDNPRAQQ